MSAAECARYHFPTLVPVALDERARGIPFSFRHSCASIEVRVAFFKFIINSLLLHEKGFSPSEQHGDGVDILA